eukprot:488774-Rhodomonas_salina.2
MPGWGGCRGGGGSDGGSQQPLGENVRGNGSKNCVHAPNAAKLKAKCNRCGEGFHHEFFECPAVFADASGGFDMPGWSIENGKQVKDPAMWSCDSINYTCRQAWRDAHSRRYFLENPSAKWAAKQSTSESDFSCGSVMVCRCVFLLAMSYTPYYAPGVECSWIGGGA